MADEAMLVVVMRYFRRLEEGMDVRFIDPREAVLTETGLGLDAIGSLQGVKLTRKHIEADHSYRLRLIARLRGEIGVDEFVFS